jgi:TolB-like protein/DNA-binding winged helix-turn-helix (wHTH) protein/Tfp pilus assembly protein PilF
MLRFGPFALDPDTGELRRDGELVPLAPQPFRLLLALASRPGELLTREELRQQVWGDGTFVDFERGLNFCVLQARTALGDDAKEPLYIETLPRRGYRFVAPVNTPASEAPPKRRRRPNPSGLVAAAALVVFVLVAAWHRAQPADGLKTMIAVLPFDGADVAFADGMTSELITHLGALQPSRLGVIARTSTRTYRGTSKSVRDIGHELGVDYVVEGRVQREADRVRVTAQLIDTRDQTQLWGESFDRRGAGALAIQRDVAEKVAKALRIELLAEDTLTARSPAAHEAYLRGRQLWSEGTTPALRESVRELREATRLEPSYVLPHIALAESLHLLAMREQIDARAAGQEIRRESETALRLAPALAQSHATEAMFRFWYDWNWDAAEESYRKAIRLNPNEPGALHDHGWLLLVQGEFEEGLAEIRRAQELDPVSPRANMHVAWAYIYTGQYAQAVRESRRALELSPGFQEAYHCLEDAYLLSGNYESALAARKMRDPSVTATDAKQYFAGDQAASVKKIEARNPYGAAVTYARAGDRDNALRWLTKAKETRNLSFPLSGIDPKLAVLRGDARYVELLAGAGLQPVKLR